MDLPLANAEQVGQGDVRQVRHVVLDPLGQVLDRRLRRVSEDGDVDDLGAPRDLPDERLLRLGGAGPLEGADVGDVASELDRSQGAVYMLRARAHDRLKGILGSASQFWSDGA